MSKVSPDVPIHPNNIAAIQTHDIEGSISFFHQIQKILELMIRFLHISCKGYMRSRDMIYFIQLRVPVAETSAISFW